jgi:hypothetical protein
LHKTAGQSIVPIVRYQPRAGVSAAASVAALAVGSWLQSTHVPILLVDRPTLMACRRGACACSRCKKHTGALISRSSKCGNYTSRRATNDHCRYSQARA